MSSYAYSKYENQTGLQLSRRNARRCKEKYKYQFINKTRKKVKKWILKRFFKDMKKNQNNLNFN